MSYAVERAELLGKRMFKLAGKGAPFGYTFDGESVHTSKRETREKTGCYKWEVRPATASEYLAYSVMEVEVRVSLEDKSYRSAELLLEYGSPTTRVDTDTRTIRVTTSDEVGAYSLPTEYVDLLDEEIALQFG